METQLLLFLATLVTAAVTLAVGIITARQSRAAKNEEVRAAPYEALAARVDSLERQVGSLRTDVRSLTDENAFLADQNTALVEYVLHVAHGVADRTIPPWPPIPRALRDRLTLDDLPDLTARNPPDDGQPADVTTT